MKNSKKGTLIFYSTASNYRQFSTNIKIKIIKFIPVLLARDLRPIRDNKKGFNRIFLSFYIHGKLSIIRCENNYYWFLGLGFHQILNYKVIFGILCYFYIFPVIARTQTYHPNDNYWCKCVNSSFNFNRSRRTYKCIVAAREGGYIIMVPKVISIACFQVWVL